MIEYRQYRVTSEAYNQERLLRDLVLRQPLGQTLSAVDVEDDPYQIHIGAFSDSRLIACALIQRIRENAVRLRQMAVAADFQRQGIGRELLRQAEECSAKLGIVTITISARKYAVAFYEKAGFDIVSESYESVGIPHFRMEKNIVRR